MFVQASSFWGRAAVKRRGRGGGDPPKGEYGLGGRDAGGVAPEDRGGLGGDVTEGAEDEGDELSAGEGSCGDGSHTDTSERGVEWQVGLFVMFSLTADSRCSLLVRQIDDVVRVDEEDELKVHWYTPKKRAMPRCRSIYGKGGWSQAFKL